MTMATTIKLYQYTVQLKDARTDEISVDTITLDQARIQAAHLVGLNDKDLIFRLYNAKGYRVREISAPVKKTIEMDLEQLLGCSCSPEGQNSTSVGRIGGDVGGTV